MPRQRKSTIHSDDWYEPKIQDRQQKKKKNTKKNLKCGKRFLRGNFFNNIHPCFVVNNENNVFKHQM